METVFDYNITDKEREEIEFQVFIRPFPVQVDVEV